jgi:site-specific DNA-cytosine methylase
VRQLTHGSLFAGIEGFGLGFRQAGFQTVWAVEKEPFCQAITRTHFPGTEIHSDVHDVGKHNLAAVDVLTAGFPCQDLSVAGKRAGLGGARSGLFWQAHRIIGELQPAWFVIENVPGLFSSNSGRDFAILLRGLDELGYGLAWRVFDSQFFGVAQRRRRVFIVGCLGKPCPEAVLFESEGGEGDFAESGETRPYVAHAVGGSSVSSGYRFDPNGEELIPCIGSLQSHAREHGHASQGGTVVGAIGARSRNSADEAAAGHYVTGAITNFSSGGSDDNDGRNGFLHVSTAPDSDRMRSFTELPEGLDSARYRALGNAVTANVANWIAEKIKAQIEKEDSHGATAGRAEQGD